MEAFRLDKFYLHGIVLPKMSLKYYLPSNSFSNLNSSKCNIIVFVVEADVFVLRDTLNINLFNLLLRFSPQLMAIYIHAKFMMLLRFFGILNPKTSYQKVKKTVFLKSLLMVRDAKPV